VGHLSGQKVIQPFEVDQEEAFDRDLSYAADFAGIMGQEHVKRAIGWWMKERFRTMRTHKRRNSVLNVSRLIAHLGSNSGTAASAELFAVRSGVAV
jgi:hypothetical protein